MSINQEEIQQDDLEGTVILNSDEKILAELDITQAVINELNSRWADISQLDPMIDGDYSAIKKGLDELRPIRIKLEERRKLLKAPIIQKGKDLDGAAAEFTRHIVNLEEPLKILKQQADDEKERIEQEAVLKEEERINNIKMRIEEIEHYFECIEPDVLSSTIKLEIKNLSEIAIGDEFEEFKSEAKTTKENTLLLLEGALAKREKLELEEKTRLEAEAKLKTEQEEFARQKSDFERQKKELADRKEAVERVERDEQIRKEATEKATKEAERAAERAIDEAQRKELEAKQQVEQGKKDAELVIKRVEEETRQKIIREQIVVRGQQAIERDKEEVKKTKTAHRKRIEKEAIESLFVNGADKAKFHELIRLIADNKIKHISINY